MAAPPTNRDPRFAGWIRLGGIVLVVAALHAAREVLIPISLAVLLAFALAPLARRLERLGLGVLGSTLACAVLAFAVIGGVAYTVTGQVLYLAAELPQYRENIGARMRALRDGGDSSLSKAAAVLEETAREVEKEIEAEEQREAAVERAVDGEPAPADPDSDLLGRLADVLEGDAPPIPVVVQRAEPTTSERLRALLAPALAPLATAAIVAVFTVFVLLQRRDLRDRLIRLAGQGRVDVTTQAMNEAGARISRYLLAQLAVNVTYGIPVWIGLAVIGVPGAPLWGLFAACVRFIPYVGPWLGATLPVLLSLAVFEDWSRPLAVIGLYVALELWSNNVMEPWLYGASTGMSPVAVLTAVVFWGWLWGPIGLLLAVPLTVCLVVLGKYVPQLEGFSILLGREPALPPGTRIYQRLLAADEDEALELAEELEREGGAPELLDEGLLPALHQAEGDRHAGRIDRARHRAVLAALREILDEVAPPPEEEPEEPARVLCLPAADEADELAARLLARALAHAGVAAETLPAETLAAERVEAVRERAPRLVLLSAVPPDALRHARYVALRLRADLAPGARADLAPRLVACLWGWRGDRSRATRRLAAAGAAATVFTIAEAVAAASPEPTRPPAPRHAVAARG